MKETSGELYQSSQFAKAMVVADSKAGKTCGIVASLLGVFPWQKEGGVVTSPLHLHIISFDANALGNISRFVLQTCGAQKEALGFRVYNMQDDLREAFENKQDFSLAFYNTLMATIDVVAGRVEKEKGIHALVFSSLTGAANGLKRSLFGPPKLDQSNKSTGSVPKWDGYSQQLSQLQNFAQQDNWHTVWETHKFKSPDGEKDIIAVQGSVGKNWAYNVEQVFGYRRVPGVKYEKTPCEKVHFETRPSLEFAANGRGFSECLDPQETDLTVAFRKLGLKVGNWGAKK